MTTELRDDSERPQPLGLGSSEGLGPLPKPDGWIYDGHPDGLQFKRHAPTGIEALVRSSAPMFTAHQMRAYAAQEVAAERERCAKLVETQDPNGDYGVRSWFELLAAKIRA